MKGLASYCKAETTFTFHFFILTLSNAFFSINNREMKSESGFSLAMASQPFRFLYYFFFLLIRILLRLAPTQVGFFGRFCGCDGGVGSHDCGCGSHHTPPTLLPSSHMHSWPINSQSTFCSLPITSALAGTLAHAFGNSMLLI